MAGGILRASLWYIQLKTQSLALLEMLVQDSPLRARYVMISGQVPTKTRGKRIDPASLPADWREISARGANCSRSGNNGRRCVLVPCWRFPVQSSRLKPTICSTLTMPISLMSKLEREKNG